MIASLPRAVPSCHWVAPRCIRHAATALALAALSLPCIAATYTVSTPSNAGAGSLRQAILDSNASGAPGGIVSGANTINVATTGTITLLDALPMVFSSLG